MNSTIEKEEVEVDVELEYEYNNLQPQYFDSLNRIDFVKKVIQIIENLSEQKLSKCYAIRGSWGVGKTRVLDMIEKELLNEYRQADAYDKYIIFHYNAWEYDYYEEPLLAMVTSMYKSLDKECNLISEKLRKKIKGFFEGATGIINLASKSHPVGWLSNLFPQEKAMSKEVEAQILDPNDHLNKTMEKLKIDLENLSSDVTIIVVVDELDRCLPKYAIKVLERLHHIFNDMKNTQVILSVDYDQLENTIKMIFGEKTSTKRYLSKFINFSITLDEGHLEDNFDTQFADYVKNFDCLSDCTKEDDVSLFKRNILDGIDMRKRIEIINKCSLLHTLLNKDNQKTDYSIMCIEILLTLYKTTSHISFGYPQLFSSRNNTVIPDGLGKLNQIYVDNHNLDGRYFSFKYIYHQNHDTLISLSDIWCVLLLCSRRISGHARNDKITNVRYEEKNIKKYCDDYWSLLQIIN